MSVGIYMYQNKINKKVYIGQSVSLERRKKEHEMRAFNDYPSNSDYNSLFYQALRKYGLENFEYSILEICNIKDLDKREIFWIKEKKSKSPRGYNLTNGGSTGYNSVYADSTIDEVKYLLKNTKKTHEEISEITGVENSYISKIRNGYYRVSDDEEYPLRPFNKIYGNNKYLCIDCGINIDPKATRCKTCSNLHRRKAERPEPLFLAKKIVQQGFEATGREYGVSGNAIKKWCAAYGIGRLKHEVAMWYQKQKDL